MAQLLEHDGQSRSTGVGGAIGNGGAYLAGAHAEVAGPGREEPGAEFACNGRATFADSRPVPDHQSIWTTICGKASRLLARRVPTKTMRKVDPQPLVSFTFDDAPASSCREGAAILEAYGMRGTYYVCAGGCGAASPSGPLASADDIGALLARGHEIGCR